MTKEEIQKNSEHWYELYKKENAENEQLKAQIEKMKVCSSCANSTRWGECDYNSNICYNCDEKSEWQLKE